MSPLNETNPLVRTYHLPCSFRPHIQLHYLSAYKAAFIDREPLKKEELRSLVRESYYDFPVYEESLSHLGQTQY